jgi:NADPH:quinone reductase-like Zn-dependent oxidoreductase
MKAYRFDSFDSLDELRVREEADPRPQRGEALVRVRAVSAARALPAQMPPRSDPRQ